MVRLIQATGKPVFSFFLFILAVVVPHEGNAGDRLTDISLDYHARETLNRRDNDILRFRYGIEHPGIAGLSRLTLFGGFRDIGINFMADSETVSFDELDLGVEALWLRDGADRRSGPGARINYAQDQKTSLELAWIHESFGERFDLRFMGGVQGVAGSVTGRDDFGVFGLGEATWWYNENFAIRGGLLADTDGELISVGFEMAAPNRPISFYLDWGVAIDDYRGISGYNDVSGGIRIALGGGKLRDTHRKRGLRSMFRSVEVQ